MQRGTEDRDVETRVKRKRRKRGRDGNQEAESIQCELRGAKRKALMVTMIGAGNASVIESGRETEKIAKKGRTKKINRKKREIET